MAWTTGGGGGKVRRVKNWLAIGGKLPRTGPWLAVLALPARACVETTGTSDSQYINLGLNGASFSGAISINNAAGIGATFCSGVFLNSRWILTAAHPVTDYSGNVINTVGGIYLGTPITANSQLLPVAASFIYPGFNNSGNGPDLMLLELAAPVTVPTLNIGSASPGNVVTSYGYGVVNGVNYADGNLRGWQAPVIDGLDPSFNRVFYQETAFGGAGTSGILNGMAGSGDSGCGVFSSSGQLVGITVGSALPFSQFGDTIYDNISQTNEYAWIMNTITPVAAQLLSVTATNADVQLAWSGKGGTNYVVQAARALGGTNTFTDISGVIALPGTGVVQTNFTDIGALTNFPARYYRIRTY